MDTPAWIVVIVLTSVLGVYLLVGYDDGWTGGGWFEEHFDILDEQMSSLAECLREFKKSHGRYPSTDEGLGALDNFAARTKITMFRPQSKYETDGLYSFSPTGYARQTALFWSMAHRRVRAYRIERGHPPRTLEELGKAGFLWGWEQLMMTDEEELSRVIKDLELETVKRELAIGHDDVVFLIGPTGALSPWQMPYVYENRHDAAGTLFADSPADSYGAGHYSVKIDDGVYIWSVVAKNYSDEYWASWFKFVMIRCTGVGLLILAIGLTWWKVRGRARIPAVIGLVIGAAAGATPAVTRSIALCYVMTPIFGHHDPAMVSRRRALLDKYREAGAISVETYAKSVESMGLKATERAVTRPDDGE